MKRICLMVLVVALMGALAACSQVPLTGRSRLLLTSVATENQMGARAYDDIIGKAKLSDDAAANAILQRVGRRISAKAHVPGAEWEFKLIESEQANAFALPGGKVAVYTGIFRACKNEAGLAAVIGHEVGHVIARHSGERISLGLTVQVLLTGAGAVTGEWSPAKREALLAAMGLGAQVGVMLPYSRKHEYEADLIGIRLMARAGYDPSEAAKLWGRMDQLSKNKPLEMFSTHPPSAKRMKTLRQMQPDMMKLYDKVPEKHGVGVALPGTP